MMASRVIASIDSALEFLEWWRTLFFSDASDEPVIIMKHKLRGLRTFLLCSTILERTEDNNDGEVTRSKILMEKLRILRGFLLCPTNLTNNVELRTDTNYDATVTSLGSLFVRIDGVVSAIHINVDSISRLSESLSELDLFEEDIDKWYTILSDYLHQSPSSSVLANQVKNIFDSVLGNLDDFLSFHRTYIGILVQPIEALKENIIFWRIFFSSSSILQCSENREFQCLLTLIEPIAIKAAHLTVHLFSGTHYNADAFSNGVGNFSYDGIKSMISDLQLRIKPVDDPLVHKTYSQALANLESSRGLCKRTLNMKDFIAFILSSLWEMLQFGYAPVVSLKDKLQALYEEVRLLTTILEKKPNMLVGNIKDIVVDAIFDVGVIIFSLYLNDFIIDHQLQEFLRNMKVIRTEILEDQAVKTSEYNFPSTNLLGFVDFLLSDYLTEVQISKFDSYTQSFVPKIQEYLVFLRSFMGKLVELRKQQEELHQAVWNVAAEVAYKIEFLIDQLVLERILDSFSTSFQSITDDIMIIKTNSMEIFDERRPLRPDMKIQKITWTSIDQEPSQSSSVADEVVGFEAERSSIIDRLRRGSKKLQVVAIVGMAGLGKTTLATRVYNDPSVGYHFHVRAWCSVSQVFSRRKILCELSSQIRPNGTFTGDDDDELSQQLWRSLKGRRYLIFIDDIWDIQSFECLKESFPDDSTGSRILLTSRHGDVAPEAMIDDQPLYLRQLTEGESLGLLQTKLFPGKAWPPSLYDFRMEVAEYCKGLPLTILIVAGILKTTKQEVWKDVLENLRSGIISTLTDECVSSIELSFKHLPDHLKPCFLSFGAFPEDKKVSVKKLIWLWIAEGFVQKSESKSLEKVAEDYLMTLVNRSLVMNAKESSGGAVRTCQIHDLLHDFCLRKADEELFLHVLKGGPLPFHELGNLRRLCVYSKAEHFKECMLFCPRLRSLLFFDKTERGKRLDMAFIFRTSKLLRVLGIYRVGLAHFPSEIGSLVQLRYLAIQVTYNVSPSICNLTNLETLILYPRKREGTRLPDTLWNMRKLRHLYFSSKSDSMVLPVENLDSSCNLLELDSLSTLHWHSDCNIMEKQLRRFVNIRQLKCRLSRFVYEDGYLKVMPFSCLSQLESLSLLSFDGIGAFSIELTLPGSIKKLVLRVAFLSWESVSKIALLPNLEVLKLISVKFRWNTWHVQEGEFPKLRYLMLKSWGMVKWTADSDDQFSSLEQLVLVDCTGLEEIPECFNNAATLKMIEVKGCPLRVSSLVEKVEAFQKDMGNSALRVHVHDIYRE